MLCCTVIYLLLSIVACTTQQVSYQLNIEPILNEKCIECHTSPNGIGYIKTGLEMSSYESLMNGTVYGPVVLAGDSQRSIFNMLVEGRADKLHQILQIKNKSLSDEEIMLLELWVDQGALNN